MPSKKRRTGKKAAKKKAGPRKRVSSRDRRQASASNPPVTGFETEQLLQKIHRAMGEREFESPSDLQEFLDGFTGKTIDEIVLETESDSERAQQLVYEAFEVFPSKQAATLAKRALALDDGCIDAQVMLAQLSGSSRDDYAAELEGIVSSAEARLGPTIEEWAGHFWGILETRPYMRACLELAFALWRSGRELEACERLARMLELNPDDNQGVRGTLVGFRLATGDVAGARRVLDQYSDTGEAVLAWGRVLAYWMDDDPDAASGRTRGRPEGESPCRALLRRLRGPPRD